MSRAVVKTMKNTPTRTPKPKKKKEIREDDIEPRNKWWEDVDNDGEISRSEVKWWQMEHHGFLFPPSYVKHGVPLIYDGMKVELSAPAEEIATCYASAIGTDHEKKERFITNFWAAFTNAMTEAEKLKLTRFDKCDFSLLRTNLLDERERKKARTKEEKDAELKSKTYYQYALVNGVREKVGSYMVEPPQLFRGRGEHPMQGMLKERVPPEECVLNCDPDAPVPRVPRGSYPGHAWRDILHDDSVTWLAYYDQTRSDESRKYFFLAGSSGIKGQNDLYKYEKARRLHVKIHGIRKDYRRKLTKSSNMQMKQLGAATFLIDRLALRVGGEKDTDMEADTVGCTSLRVEHLKFNNPADENPPVYKVTFDFLGKDSVRYLNEIEVPPILYNKLREFTTGKSPSAQVFDEIDPSVINEYFKEFMPDLSAKVFRTYNASITLEEQLAEAVPDKAVDMVKYYNDANKKVAILCNHQKGVAKTHGDSIQKLKIKFENIAAEVKAVREQLKELQNGSTRPIREGEVFSKLPQTELQCKTKIQQLKERARKVANEMTQKESNKNVSLSTSRINYMDPRITVAFCKRVGLDVKQIFNATIIQKFPWAMAATPDFKFRTEKETRFEDALQEARDAMAKQGIQVNDNDAEED